MVMRERNRKRGAWQRESDWNNPHRSRDGRTTPAWLRPASRTEQLPEISDVHAPSQCPKPNRGSPPRRAAASLTKPSPETERRDAIAVHRDAG